tara:strand:+ start:723 stop:1049 length:327 start_codon:yes stop_codon:yes gene_type:complete
MTDILKAIVAINPNALVSVNSEDIDQITWLGGTTPIAKADIQAKITELQTAHNAQDYARARADAYPSIGDQLDMLWHAVDTGDWTAAKVKTTEFYTALKAVKDANPKP